MSNFFKKKLDISIKPDILYYEGGCMPNGKVKWFNERKGYGFIEQDDGSEIFVHYSDLEGEGFKTLDEGDEVEFEVVKGEKGPKAVHVVKK